MDTSKHGCFNRKAFKKRLTVPNGYEHRKNSVVGGTAAVLKFKTIPFVMSMECQHDKRATDPRCDGCKWR